MWHFFSNDNSMQIEVIREESGRIIELARFMKTSACEVLRHAEKIPSLSDDDFGTWLDSFRAQLVAVIMGHAWVCVESFEPFPLMAKEATQIVGMTALECNISGINEKIKEIGLEIDMTDDLLRFKDLKTGEYVTTKLEKSATGEAK